mmetsp:Transcript_28687/g.72738  ORF Transcript_28687/g.72738 Transcript_28687/m.72738 type:complete len:404 (+) Transcript_28687:24-1235(+)
MDACTLWSLPVQSLAVGRQQRWHLEDTYRNEISRGGVHGLQVVEDLRGLKHLNSCVRVSQVGHLESTRPLDHLVAIRGASRARHQQVRQAETAELLADDAHEGRGLVAPELQRLPRFVLEPGPDFPTFARHPPCQSGVAAGDHRDGLAEGDRHRVAAGAVGVEEVIDDVIRLEHFDLLCGVHEEGHRPPARAPRELTREAGASSGAGSQLDGQVQHADCLSDLSAEWRGLVLVEDQRLRGSPQLAIQRIAAVSKGHWAELQGIPPFLEALLGAAHEPRPPTDDEDRGSEAQRQSNPGAQQRRHQIVPRHRQWLRSRRLETLRHFQGLQSRRLHHPARGRPQPAGDRPQLGGPSESGRCKRQPKGARKLSLGPCEEEAQRQERDGRRGGPHEGGIVVAAHGEQV